MFSKVAKTLFGSRNDRIIKKLRQRVPRINKLEPELQALDDDALRARTDQFRARLEAGETLDQLLEEAFAVCREAAVRGGPLVILFSHELEASQRAVVDAGGEITKEIVSFPGGRRFQFVDPAGNELAVWSDK